MLLLLILSVVFIIGGILILIFAKRIFPPQYGMSDLQKQAAGFDRHHAFRALGAMLIALGLFLILMNVVEIYMFLWGII